MSPQGVRPVPDGMKEGLLLQPIGPERLPDPWSVLPPGRPRNLAGRLTRGAPGPPEVREESAVRVAADMEVVEEVTTAAGATAAAEGTAAAADAPAN
jgi:hypothetical protein